MVAIVRKYLVKVVTLHVQFSLHGGGFTGSIIEAVDYPSSDMDWVVWTIVKLKFLLFG